ncbi:Uncharacterized conserved protein [Ceraceosorus bombacis]|uniref:Uncharacterized conserved protein n=1 Tax=Ceraceosorus bombacis TaxID=401625 RepID=A0A0P1BQ79_9BASI|nr:Uncharacterized conserved protein [Ceraceosorus bombacis]
MSAQASSRSDANIGDLHSGAKGKARAFDTSEAGTSASSQALPLHPLATRERAASRDPGTNLPPYGSRSQDISPTPSLEPPPPVPPKSPRHSRIEVPTDYGSVSNLQDYYTVSEASVPSRPSEASRESAIQSLRTRTGAWALKARTTPRSFRPSTADTSSTQTATAPGSDNNSRLGVGSETRDGAISPALKDGRSSETRGLLSSSFFNLVRGRKTSDAGLERAKSPVMNGAAHPQLLLGGEGIDGGSLRNNEDRPGSRLRLQARDAEAVDDSTDLLREMLGDLEKEALREERIQKTLASRSAHAPSAPSSRAASALGFVTAGSLGRSVKRSLGRPASNRSRSGSIDSKSVASASGKSDTGKSNKAKEKSPLMVDGQPFENPANSSSRLIPKAFGRLRKYSETDTTSRASNEAEEQPFKKPAYDLASQPAPASEDVVPKQASLLPDAIANNMFAESLGKLDPLPLKQAQLGLVVIGQGHWHVTKSYKEVMGVPRWIPMYSDPTRKIYKALGMTLRTNDQGPACTKPDYQTRGNFKGTMVAIKRGVIDMPLRPPGDLKLLGGEFILGPGLDCSFTHRMVTVRGHLDLRRVLVQAGCDMSLKSARDILEEGSLQSRAGSTASLGRTKSRAARKSAFLDRKGKSALFGSVLFGERPGDLGRSSQNPSVSSVNLAHPVLDGTNASSRPSSSHSYAKGRASQLGAPFHPGTDYATQETPGARPTSRGSAKSLSAKRNNVVPSSDLRDRPRSSASSRTVPSSLKMSTASYSSRPTTADSPSTSTGSKPPPTSLSKSTGGSRTVSVVRASPTPRDALFESETSDDEWGGAAPLGHNPKRNTFSSDVSDEDNALNGRWDRDSIGSSASLKSPILQKSSSANSDIMGPSSSSIPPSPDQSASKSTQPEQAPMASSDREASGRSLADDLSDSDTDSDDFTDSDSSDEDGVGGRYRGFGTEAPLQARSWADMQRGRDAPLQPPGRGGSFRVPPHRLYKSSSFGNLNNRRLSAFLEEEEEEWEEEEHQAQTEDEDDTSTGGQSNGGPLTDTDEEGAQISGAKVREVSPDLDDQDSDDGSSEEAYLTGNDSTGPSRSNSAALDLVGLHGLQRKSGSFEQQALGDAESTSDLDESHSSGATVGPSPNGHTTPNVQASSGQLEDGDEFEDVSDDDSESDAATPLARTVPLAAV